MTEFIKMVNCGGDYDDPCWVSYAYCLKRTKMQTTDCYGCNPEQEENLVGCSKCHKVIRITSDGKHARYNDNLALQYFKNSSGRWECGSPYLTDIHTCPYCFERDNVARSVVNSEIQQQNGQSSSNKTTSSSSWWGKSNGNKEKKSWW